MANSKYKPIETNFSFERLPSWAWLNYSAQGYFGGCESGKAAGYAYLKYLLVRKHGGGGNLQHVVFDMADKLSKTTDGSQEYYAVRGQIVGIFHLLDEILENAVKHGNVRISGITSDQIIAVLEDTERGGPEAMFELVEKKSRSESARKAANARWGKVESVQYA